jgi:hypothetical protein
MCSSGLDALSVRIAQSFLEAQAFDLPLHPLLPHTRC